MIKNILKNFFDVDKEMYISKEQTKETCEIIKEYLERGLFFYEDEVEE